MSHFRFEEGEIASLAVEFSDISPGLKTKVVDKIAQEFSQLFLHFIKEQFGVTLDEYTQHQILNIHNRVIVLPKNSGPDEYKSQIHGLPDEDTHKTMAIADVQNGVIWLTNTDGFWDTEYDYFPYLPPKEALIAQFGENAKNVAYVFALTHLLTHEIIHFSHDRTIPYLLKEAGTRWYQYHLYGRNSRYYLIQDQDANMINFYTSLIEKYGDTVHKVFFGLRCNVIKRIQILTRVLQIGQL